MLELDWTFALEEALGTGRGLPAGAMRAAAERLGDPGARVEADRAAGRAAFLDLPLDRSSAEAVLAWRGQAPTARDLVLAGIGGSALSARVFDALRAPQEKAPRLHVLDTIDPLRVEPLLRSLDPAETVLLGISKSGATLETWANFLIFEARMREALGDRARERIAVVCGPGPNPLRERAAESGYPCFDVPSDVGGRYSALTAVGLLPAACLGVDPRRLLAGAARARERCRRPRLEENPALALAALHAAAQAAGRPTTVLWPYGERLADLGPWWAQLLAESLGKPHPGGLAGPTPLAAVGPRDQHSLLQMLVEGPDDKLTVFVTADTLQGPRVPGEDRSLGGLMRAELEGTEYALAQAGRPTATLRLARFEPESVGAFLLTYQVATVWWGALLGVDPFGQPGVELGKQAARAHLTGEPADLARALDAHRDRPRRISR